MNLTITQLADNYKNVLKTVYVASEYIDPLEEMIQKIDNSKARPFSIPFAAAHNDEVVSFFCIDDSNSCVGFKTEDTGALWLEAFFITRPFLGKGHGRDVVRTILIQLPAFFPDARSLNLTVNMRNTIAQHIYKTSGFRDTGIVYKGGPAGPQHIYEITLPVQPV